MGAPLANNRLQVRAAEFKTAMKVFRSKRAKLGPVLLAFEGGFLSIESGEATAVMHATGEWHGRASFSPEILRALATVPPAQDPIPVAYADGHLMIGSLTIPCEWRIVSQAFIHDLANPGLLDLLALEQTVSRVEIRGAELGQQIRCAREKVERRIRNAAKQLAELEVTEAEIRAMVEARIAARIRTDEPVV